MSYSVSMDKNRVAAGSNETDFIFIPRVPILGKPGVVLFHGATTPNMGVSSAGWPDLMRLAAALANAGFTIVCPSNNVDAYANDTAMTRIDSAITLLGTLGCSSTRAHLIGVSMGGGTIARYAGLNPTKVASVNALIPMANPSAIYKGIWGPGTTAGTESDTFLIPIAAAWGMTPHAVTFAVTLGSPNLTLTAGSASSADVGGSIGFTAHGIAVVSSVTDSTHIVIDRNGVATGSFTANMYAPLPSGADIIGGAAAAKIANVPGRLFYGTLDPYIRPADVTALATAAGWEANSFAGLGHTNAAAAAWRTYNGGSEFSDLVAYLTAHNV